MAFCPKCSKEMGATEKVCPHCGYDFTPCADERRRRTGIEYSFLADIALIVGGIVAAFSCIGSIIYSILMVFALNFWQAFVIGPIIFFLNLAMLVVFLRIQKIS